MVKDGLEASDIIQWKPSISDTLEPRSVLVRGVGYIVQGVLGSFYEYRGVLIAAVWNKGVPLYMHAVANLRGADIFQEFAAKRLSLY